MANAVNVLLVGEKQAMARIRRWIRRALPSFRLTVASDPASWTASLKKKDIGLALVQRPLGWGGEPQVERRIKERWPGCVLLWLGTTGVRHDLGAALLADVDGMLADSPALEQDLAFHLQLALARGADRAAFSDSAGEVIARQGSLLDVAERRKLEVEIRASEERFRALVQNASDVIAVINAAGEFQYLTPSVETHLGYRPDDLVGTSGFALVHPDDLATVQAAFASVMQRTNPGTPTEYRFRHAGGDWVVVELIARNLLDQPAVGGIVLTTRVITERRQAEADLRESRRRLGTLLGNLPGMAYRCRNDRQWTMELVSEGCLGLTGFPAADVQGNRVVSYASLIHPEDQAMVWDEVQAAVREGRLFQLTYRIATAQGEMRWVWEQGGAVSTAPDGVELLEGFIADISNRKAAEEDLRSSRAWLQHIVEAVDDLLVVYDADGRYIDVIAGDDSLLMRPAVEMLGRTVTEILPAETAQRFLSGIRIVLEQGAPYDFEYPLAVPGGVRWFRARGRRIRASEGARPLTLWSISDLTERKATEEALMRQSRQLELLSRTSQQLNSVLEMPAVLRALVASGLDLVDAAAGTAGLWTGETMQFTEYNNDGLLRPIDSALVLGEGVSGVVAETRRPYLANDPTADRLLAAAGQDLGIRNLVNVPILSREGALLGCLEVHNKRRGESFDEGDVSMLEGLASSAAVALENARLLEERLRAEDDLRQLKEFNEDIVQSMGEGIVLQDRMGRFTFVNPAAAAMLGYDADELLGAPWTKVVPPDQHAIVQEVDAAREAGGASRYEIEFVRKDGRRVPALVSGNPRFEGGQFVGMLAVFADISDRKQAEVALRESEEQLRSMAEKSPSMIFINQGGRIVYVNPQCSLTTGYTPEELLSEGFHFESLVAPESMTVVTGGIRPPRSRRRRTGLRVRPAHTPGRALDGHQRHQTDQLSRASGDPGLDHRYQRTQTCRAGGPSRAGLLRRRAQQLAGHLLHVRPGRKARAMEPAGGSDPGLLGRGAFGDDGSGLLCACRPQGCAGNHRRNFRHRRRAS